MSISSNSILKTTGLSVIPNTVLAVGNGVLGTIGGITKWTAGSIWKLMMNAPVIPVSR